MDVRTCLLNSVKMNSASVINALFDLFGQKKNKLTWSGTLEDLKKFIAMMTDEQTAQNFNMAFA